MRFTVFFLLISLLGLCGCNSGKVLINGEWTEVLSPREEQILIGTARATLAKNKRLTAQEREFIKRQEPELKIRYTGDRTGDANFIWQMPDKRVTLLMRGTFFSHTAQWVMKVYNKGPEVLDFSKQTDPAVEKK